MKRKINKKNYKLILITTIFIILIGMGLGFSYLNTSLSINGVVTVNRPKELLMTKIAEQAVLDNIASKYVTSETGIDFGQISSDTNGKGVYLLSSTKGEENPIYYYRGEVDNNNVKFANFCWKIVRTTETGGVKLIYNGASNTTGGCTNTTGETTEIGNSMYNTNSNDNAYIGYMYGTVGASTYENTHKNTNDSDIKKVIDDWYRKNMTAYNDKLEDTVWCNDRSIVISNTGDGIGSTETIYGSMNRRSAPITPSLECKNPNDRFTVESLNGNGALTYPVAMLTMDEMMYAGAVYGPPQSENSSYYLYTQSAYWSLTPIEFRTHNTSEQAIRYVVTSLGNIYASNYYNYFGKNASIGVRPSISLKSGITISDGDGTPTSPYIISN